MNPIDVPPFEPLFSKETVLENLSAENCLARDEKRRIAALVCTRTSTELLEAVRENPAAGLYMADVVEDIHVHVVAEQTVMAAAGARLAWALAELGIERIAARKSDG